MAEVVAVCISENKGERKKPVAMVELRVDHGIVGDARVAEQQKAQEMILKKKALAQKPKITKQK